MKVIRGRNTSETLVKGLYALREDGVGQGSRNGDVVKYPSPVSTVTERPEERVLFYDWRDANPFFHLYEALWMLAGRRDVAPLTRFVKRMKEFSDDEETFNAAYGYRWRHARGWTGAGSNFEGGSRVDQLDKIIKELHDNPYTRQCVLQIWDHASDLGVATKDHACNIAATFQLDHHGHLEMVVFCRSNDSIWGCHGANAVHFSMLMEYVSAAIDKPIGSMTQVSVNYHAYDELFEKTYHGMILGPDYASEPYRNGEVSAYPLIQTPIWVWDEDCRKFISLDGGIPAHPVNTFRDPFFRDVAWPIVRAHDIWKDHKDYDSAMVVLNGCIASDWRRACQEWLTRRKDKQ